MSHLRIAIVDQPADSDRAAWWRAEIPRHWPRPGERPICESVSLEVLSTTIAGRSGHGAQAVLILHGTGEHSRSALMQLLDRLIGARTPAVVLAKEPDLLRVELESQGIPVESHSADAAMVATIVHALVTRQTALDLLATELHVARASQGGLSGEIGRLHEELQLAGTVQRRFLPKQLPEMPGYEFGVFFRPCGFVSGDIYDAVRIGRTRIAFMLADAVGHGVPAALLTLVLSRALRNHDTDPGDDHPLSNPAETLARLNLEMCEENEVGDRFATAVCGVVDTASGGVTLASAGHPPALVVDAAGSVSAVAGGEGPLLGVFPTAKYTQTTLALGEGQTLLLYSDGFETAFPEPGTAPGCAGANQAYIEHFAQATTCVDGETGGAQAALQRLAADIDRQAGSLNQRDDLTALALRRMPDRSCAAVSGAVAARAAA